MDEYAWTLPKGSIRAIIAIALTSGICYLWVVAGKAPTEFFTLVIGIWVLYFGQKALATIVNKGVVKEELHPLGLPKNTVRSIIALEVVLTALYLWVIKGKVSPQVLKGAGLVVGFYFLQNGVKTAYKTIKTKNK